MVACAPSVTPTPATPQARSAWGDVIALQVANHRQAPAIHADEHRVMLAWAGADEQEARLYASTDTSDEGRILALKAYYPQDVQLYPAGRDTYHLLWLDAETSGDTLRLRSALIHADGVALVGAMTLSQATTPAYSAVSLPGGGLRVVYSTGNAPLTRLRTRTIDAEGRANFAQDLDIEGQYPNLVADSDGLRLYWLHQRRIFSARWRDDGAMMPAALGTIPVPTRASLLSFSVAHNGAHAIAFAHLWDDDVMPAVWWSSAPIGDAFAPFKPLRLQPPTDAIDAPGYNIIQAYITQEDAGGEGVTWLATVPTAEAVLPTAIVWRGTLGVLFWHEGAPRSYHNVLTQAPHLLDAPRITTARDRHLHLTWLGEGVHHLTTTRPPLPPSG